MKTVISGIQQMGVGVANLHEAFAWYRKAFGVDVPILDDEGTAELMLPYTGGKPQKRHAILAVSLKGGGGLEIWNYTQRVPQVPTFTPQLGDLGICITKIKTENAQKSFDEMKSKNIETLGEVTNNPAGAAHFFIKDPYGNIFEIIEEKSNWFGKSKRLTGGVYGAMIGVSDMEKSVKFYREILSFDKIIFDQSDATFADIAEVSGGKKFRRVLLTHSQARKGPFSELLGQGYIELFQALDYTPRKIFEGRQWGDLGFIHLCFDVKNMDGLKEISAQKGFPFTVDSGDFGMGAAAGRFTYTEDPDGTLIEFVETFKIPIIKKLGLFLNLRNRDAEKPLPRYLLKALKFMRVK